MNIQIQPQRTPAEAALVDAFGERLSLLPGDGEVMLKRDAAIEALKAGLPTRRIESWHYTDLRRLLTAVPAFDPAAAARPLGRCWKARPCLRCWTASRGQGAEVEGVVFRPLAGMLADGSFAPALDRYGTDDAIGALNAAFVADGWFVDVAAGAVVRESGRIAERAAGGQSHVRLPVRVGAGAPRHHRRRQAGEGAGLATSVSQLTLDEGAEVLWIVVQEQPETATHLAQFKAHLGKDSKLVLFVMNAGGRLVRQEVVVRTTGEGADFKLRGVNLLAGDTHTDVTMVLDHAVPHTTSTEIVRNVVTGKARGVFQGRINVHQYAQKPTPRWPATRCCCRTRRVLDSRNWRSSPTTCSAVTAPRHRDRPQPSVLSDGARHRGKTARGLLVRAFLAEVIEELEDEAIVDALETRLNDWFASMDEEGPRLRRSVPRPFMSRVVEHDQKTSSHPL